MSRNLQRIKSSIPSLCPYYFILFFDKKKKVLFFVFVNAVSIYDIIIP